MKNTDLDSIIEGCKKKNSSAQRDLYLLFSGKMFAVCKYYTANQDDAEDVLQEGFIKVFENIKGYRHQGSIEGWIRRIIINIALERIRKVNYNFISLSEMPYQDNKSDVVSDITADELMGIVMELTTQYRIVFLLYALEGYSHKEIGERLKISEGTSKSNLARARVILKKKIAEQYGKISLRKIY